MPADGDVREVTLEKRPDEKLGCRLATDGSMIVQAISDGTAAARSGAVKQYVGWKLTHVNGAPVSSAAQCSEKLQQCSTVTLRFQRDPADEAAERKLLEELLRVRQQNSTSLEQLLAEHEKSKAEEDGLMQQCAQLGEQAAALEAELQQLKQLKRQTENTRLATLARYINFLSGEG
eukprot:TRINITY_DN8226_c0_g1_i1.p1 TRINITY_DN8226_c0_g1~~TRINITY_DN8226_c0_g1_i1.p1  ORF type:complete len:204 (+),score=106.63 TRINITY_DN8226_c0_g1_i1:87-614(+)